MTTIHPNCIIITVTTSEPKEKRLWLIKSLAAALRWRASSSNKKEIDDQYQEEITDLIETLATEK